MTSRSLIATLALLPRVLTAQNVAEVQVAPPSVTIRVGERTGLLATAFDRIGNVIPTVRLIWSSNNVNVNWTSLRTDVASVDQSGNVVALAPGQGTIQATAPGGLTATAPVVVQQADFTVREAGVGTPLMLSPGEVDTLHVIVAAQNNRTVNPLVLQWASNDQSVARVSLAGVVTAAGPGKATLSVSGLLQNKSIEVSVHKVVDKPSVRPPRVPDVSVPLTGAAKFDAQALTADNTPVPEAPLRWSVADPAIASFDPQTGMLTGRAVGKTQLTVKGPGTGLAVTWTINVIAGSVRFVQPRVGIGLNQRHTLHANYADDQGNVLGAADRKSV